MCRLASRVSDYVVELEGLGPIDRGLAQLAALLLDLRPFWPRVVPLFIVWMGEQFESEGGWGGQAWAPLSPDYAAWKTQQAPDKGILSMYGDLRSAATSPRRRASANELVLTIEPYTTSRRARAGGEDREVDPDYFQSGTSSMPARPILPARLPLTAEEQLRGAVGDYLEEMVVRLGLR